MSKVVEPKRLVVSGLLALVAAYIFASLAIDRGNWFYYGLAVAGIIVAARSFWRALQSAKNK